MEKMWSSPPSESEESAAGADGATGTLGPVGHALRFFFFFLRAFFSTVLNPASAASGESIQLSSSMFWATRYSVLGDSVLSF